MAGIHQDQLEDLLIDFLIGRLQTPETSDKVKRENLKSITKANDVAEIDEDLISARKVEAA